MITGRVWKFGDQINTDMILPTAVMYRPPAEHAQHVFASTRPGWAAQVTPGDIVVAGENFGTGSARPAPLSMRTLGVGCLIADSINKLFFRNCVNFGLPAIECPGASAAFEEGDIAEVLLAEGLVRNPRTGVELRGAPVPGDLMAVMQNGGIFPMLEAEGLIGPEGSGRD